MQLLKGQEMGHMYAHVQSGRHLKRKELGWERGSQARIIIIVIIIILKGQCIWHVSFNQQTGSIPFSVIFPQSNLSKRYSSMCSQHSDSFYIIRATWPTISFCASSLTQLSHLQHSASFMSKNHEAKWGKRAKQSYTLTPNIYSCLLLMSNKQHQSLWVTHWVKCTCLCRTCNKFVRPQLVNFCSADSLWNREIYVTNFSYCLCLHFSFVLQSNPTDVALPSSTDQLIYRVFSTRRQPIYQK